MATIITKNSSTASSVPTAAQLVKGELAVNVTDKRLFTEDNSGNVVELGTNPSTLALSGGTANGVAYLNGSKVLTTGSALTFDGNTIKAPNANVSDSNWVGWGSDRTRLVGSSSSNFLAAFIDNTEQMRLTNTGLGIGTSSPGAKLQIGTGSATGLVDNVFLGGNSTNTAQFRWVWNHPGAGYLGIGTANDAYGSMIFGQASGVTGAVATEWMRLDSSGNLGLGVTPSAWSTLKGFQFAGGAVSGYAGGGTNNQVHLLNNAYYGSGGWTYIASDTAQRYTTVNGQHQWYTAPSGTAGNAISFTQAMTLDASGNLLVGTTSNSVSSGSKLIVNGSGFFYGNIAEVSASTSVEIGLIGGTPTIATLNNSALTFRTAGSERARITSGGEVYIAGTTDQGAYNLQVNGTGVWGAGAYVNGSDARLKENVQALTDGLSVVTQLRPVTFQYKADYSKDTAVQPGFIAQELQQAMAGKDYVNGVVQAGPEHLNVAYQSLIPVLTKAIQEQQAIIESLKARLDAANI